MARNFINAWREILFRIFEGFTFEQNVRPPWLVNPETGRVLKLDYLYSAVGLAIRFSGLRGKQQRARLSVQALAEQKARDNARDELCQAQGISLANLNMTSDKPDEIFSALETAMSQATRRLGKAETGAPLDKDDLLHQLKQARIKARELQRQIRTERDLQVYLDLWQDRQYSAMTTEAAARPEGPRLELAAGMAVEHTLFGPGMVQSVSPTADDETDSLVTIDFGHAAGQRTFLASLLPGKLTIL